MGLPEFAAQASQSLGFCYIILGELGKARESFTYSREHLPSEERWMGMVALAELAERLGEFEQAHGELRRLLHRGKLSSEAKAYVQAKLATLNASQTQWQEACLHADQALRLAHQNRQADLCAEMWVLLAQGLSRQGRFLDASNLLVRASDVVLGMGDQARQALVEAAWSELLMFAGLHEEARSRAVGALATRGGYVRSEGWALRSLAEIALLRGDTLQCRDYAVQAVSHAESNRYTVNSALASVVLTKAHAALGQTEEAARIAESARDTSRRMTLPEVELLAKSVEVLLDPEGDPARVEEFVEESGRRQLAVHGRLLIRALGANGKEAPLWLAACADRDPFDDRIWVLNNGERELKKLDAHRKKGLGGLRCGMRRIFCCSQAYFGA